MAFSHHLENDDQLLVLKFSEKLDSESLEESYGVVDSRLSKGLRQVLVLRETAATGYDFETGVDFGERMGTLLSDKGVVVAVVKGKEHRGDTAIDMSMFNEGTVLGEFESEGEARDWLAGKAT